MLLNSGIKSKCLEIWFSVISLKKKKVFYCRQCDCKRNDCELDSHSRKLNQKQSSVWNSGTRHAYLPTEVGGNLGRDCFNTMFAGTLLCGEYSVKLKKIYKKNIFCETVVSGIYHSPSETITKFSLSITALRQEPSSSMKRYFQEILKDGAV